MKTPCFYSVESRFLVGLALAAIVVGSLFAADFSLEAMSTSFASCSVMPVATLRWMRLAESGPVPAPGLARVARQKILARLGLDASAFRAE